MHSGQLGLGDDQQPWRRILTKWETTSLQLTWAPEKPLRSIAAGGEAQLRHPQRRIRQVLGVQCIWSIGPREIPTTVETELGEMGDNLDCS